MSDTPSLLRGRYAFLSRIKSEGKAARWLARESDGSRRVVALLAPADRAAQLERACRITHPHLATVLEVVRMPAPSALPAGVELPAGAVVGVAEFVPGRTLAQHVEPQPMAPGKAVAAVLKLIQAVAALHAAGVVHGAISPWSVVAEPEGRALAPVLTALLAPPVGAYCPPERLKGAVPAPSDDVWALYATLYTALTGKPPFSANQREALAKQMIAGRPKPLAEHGVEQAVLQEILSRGLIGEKRLRVVELEELTKALEGWERDPRAMPPRRQPAARAAARSMSELIQGGGAVDPDLVVDAAAVVVDLAAETSPANRGQPPPLPSGPVVSGGPPPLPVVSAGPPPLPGVTSAGPPPLPMSVTPPLPVVTSSALGATVTRQPPALPPTAPSVAAAPSPSLPVATSVIPVLTHHAVLPPAPPQATPDLAAGFAATPATATPMSEAWGSSPNGSLSALVQELPREAPAPKPLIGAVTRPVARRLSFNPFERKRKLWPIAAAAASAGGLGVYLLLAVSGAPAAPAPAPVASPAAVAKPRVAEKPRISPESKRDACVRSYFPERVFAETQQFAFVCEDTDFREVTQRLFSTVKQRPFAPGAGKDPKKPDPAAQLGWYQLPAAGIIRQGCCVGAAPLNLPDTVGWCEQLESAVRRIADDSQKAGDLAPGARSFDKAVTCLFVHGISRPYTYERQPTDTQRRAFQQFLSSAAISEARR